jgi:Aminomethyltransferase folate-binding domain
MRELAGETILGLKYYWCTEAVIAGIPVVVSRTGWTGEIGYEVFLIDPARGDDLWETIMEAGAPHRIRPIAPGEARRIEAGIFNYNSVHAMAVCMGREEQQGGRADVVEKNSSWAAQSTDKGAARVPRRRTNRWFVSPGSFRSGHRPRGVSSLWAFDHSPDCCRYC